jgi:hypothetical protein
MLNLLLLAGLAQVPEAPETSLVYSATPQISVVSAKGGRLELAWHTVTMSLDKEQAKVNCVSLFKNMSDQIVDAEVWIPVHVDGWSTNYGTGMKVLWADAAVSPVRTKDEGQDEGDMRHTTRWYIYKVSFRPHAQRSLKTEMTLPIQVTGPDGMERQVGYQFAPSDTPFETLSMSIKYSPSLVYRTIATTPRKWDWQVGARGAFVKRENFTVNGPTLATFRYYRGGFDKIGDGG